MVSSAATISGALSASPGKSSVSVRTIAYTPTLVSSPANTAVTGAGAVGYESGSQKDSGNTAALMPKATSSMTWSSVRVPWSRSPSLMARSAMLMVPVAP